MEFFQVGDLVTVNSKELKMHLARNVYDKWLENTLMDRDWETTPSK